MIVQALIRCSYCPFYEKAILSSHTILITNITAVWSQILNFLILPTHPPLPNEQPSNTALLYNTILWCSQFQSRHYFSFPPHKLCFQRIWPRAKQLFSTLESMHASIKSQTAVQRPHIYHGLIQEFTKL